MVIATIDSLAEMNYQNFEVLILDNNTRDEALWMVSATSSLPVPVSPVINTVALLRATYAERMAIANLELAMGITKTL